MIRSHLLLTLALGYSVSVSLAVADSPMSPELSGTVSLETAGGPEIHVLFRPARPGVQEYGVVIDPRQCPQIEGSYAHYPTPPSASFGRASPDGFIYRMYSLRAAGYLWPCKVRVSVMSGSVNVVEETVEVGDVAPSGVSEGKRGTLIVEGYSLERVSDRAGWLRVLLRNESNRAIVPVLIDKQLTDQCRSKVTWNLDPGPQVVGLENASYKLRPADGWIVFSLPVYFEAPSIPIPDGCSAAIEFGERTVEGHVRLFDHKFPLAVDGEYRPFTVY